MTKEKRIEQLIQDIGCLASEIGRVVNIMEVCGSHTQAISRHGVRKLMPKNIRLLSGPGCPVCVTDQSDIDAAVQLALSGIPIATYGDLLRVPGYLGSLEQSRVKGAQVFSVYSVEEALEIKKDFPGLVFFGLGFETTTPMTGFGLSQGLTVYSAHKLFLPAMDALLEMGEIRIDGFIAPGHVSSVVGMNAYRHMKVAQVIAGFTAEDVLISIYMLLNQIKIHEQKVENEYVRLVTEEGNKKARKMIFDHFKITDGIWRGFGVIPNSGLEVKDDQLNAKIKYKDILKKIDYNKSQKPTGCRCGEIIRGIKEPKQCPMFGKMCTPENPYGPCMVSEEGACNNQYRYAKR